MGDPTVLLAMLLVSSSTLAVFFLRSWITGVNPAVHPTPLAEVS
jgi:hypothetical protein